MFDLAIPSDARNLLTPPPSFFHKIIVQPTFPCQTFQQYVFRQLTFTTVSYLLIFYLSRSSKPKRCIELAIASFRSNKLQKIFKLKIEQPVRVEDLGFISFFFLTCLLTKYLKKNPNYVWVKISLKTECWL